MKACDGANDCRPGYRCLLTWDPAIGEYGNEKGCGAWATEDAHCASGTIDAYTYRCRTGPQHGADDALFGGCGASDLDLCAAYCMLGAPPSSIGVCTAPCEVGGNDCPPVDGVAYRCVGISLDATTPVGAPGVCLRACGPSAAGQNCPDEVPAKACDQALGVCRP